MHLLVCLFFNECSCLWRLGSMFVFTLKKEGKIFTRKTWLSSIFNCAFQLRMWQTSWWQWEPLISSTSAVIWPPQLQNCSSLSCSTSPFQGVIVSISATIFEDWLYLVGRDVHKSFVFLVHFTVFPAELEYVFSSRFIKVFQIKTTCIFCMVDRENVILVLLNCAGFQNEPFRILWAPLCKAIFLMQETNISEPNTYEDFALVWNVAAFGHPSLVLSLLTKLCRGFIFICTAREFVGFQVMHHI